MENNGVCKAEVKASAGKVVIIYLIVAIIITVLLSLPKTESFKGMDDITYGGKGKVIAVNEKGGRYEKTSYYLYTLHIGSKIDGDAIKWGGDKFAIAIIIAGVVLGVVPILLGVRQNIRSKRSSMELTDKAIEGKRKKLLSTESFNIPIDRLENVLVNGTIYSFLTGGKTVVIRSSSGMTKMPWVRNADEFAQAVRQKIDENKNK